MTKTFIAASTALAIALGTVGTTASVEAAPLGLSAAPQIEARTSVETVGRKGTVAAVGAVIGLGAFALGAAAAASQGHRHGGYRPARRPRRDCFVERTERWSHRRQAYVVVKEKVCY